MLRRRLPISSFVVVVTTLVACHSNHPASHPRLSPGSTIPQYPQFTLGQSNFETPLGPGGSSRTTGAAGGTDQNGDSGGTPAEGPTPSSTAPTITESDVYYLSGTTLYILNHFRGLQIVDISNPAQPTLVGRAPIYGYPTALYVDGTNAYALVSDYYDYWPVLDDGVGSFHGSQVRVIDVSDPTNPVQTSSVNVDGDITDSRIVGNVMYLVAQRYSWWDNPASTDDVTETVIVSVDVSDPSHVQTVDTEEFPQGGWNQQIMVTPYTIYVATTQWLQTTEDYTTDIQYVDISDPAGHMKVRGSVTVPGQVQDRWSMDEYNGVLRVASVRAGATATCT